MRRRNDFAEEIDAALCSVLNRAHVHDLGQNECEVYMPITGRGDSRDSKSLGSDPAGISPAVIELLTSQVQAMVEESGNPDGFDARSWLFDWLHSSVPALGGQRPVDRLHTPEGIDLISRLLASAQTGAYW